MLYNVAGLASKLADVDWVRYIERFDFVSIIETFVDDNFDLSNVFHEYDKFMCPAVKLSYHGRRSGGIVLLVKKYISKFVQEVKVSCGNVVVVKLDCELFGCDRDVLFITTYIPPPGSPFYDNVETNCQLTELETCIGDLLEQYDYPNIICSGDFNARTASYQINREFSQSDCFENSILDSCALWEGSRISQDTEINEFGKRLLELCACYDLEMLNGCVRFADSGKFTFISDHGYSVVDYFIVNQDFSDSVETLLVADRIESDHMPVEMYCVCQNITGVENHCRTGKPVKIEKYVWNTEKAAQFTDCIKSDKFREQMCNAIDLLNECPSRSLDIFTNSILNAASCMKQTVTRGGSKKYQKAKWFDEECLLKKKEVKRCLKCFRKSRRKEDYKEYARERREYKSMIQQKKRTNINASLSVLMDSAENSPKEFWGEIRKHRRRKHTVNTISEADWLNHFDKVFNEGICNEPDLADNDIVDETFDDILDAEISKLEIKKAISHLKTGKAAGPDSILSQMLKIAENEILPYLYIYFNNMFSKGYFPVQWSQAIIVPLHKKGNPNDPDNYRGISLISILSKVFTHIMNSRLTLWAETNSVLSDSQAGFRKGRSTIDHIFTLHAFIEKHLLKHTKLFVAFIDFKKAYDTVNRTVLWSVLIRCGVQGRMLRMVRALYSTVQACVLSNSGQTDFFHCLQGLKQGCVASPILFSLLINELANEIISRGKHGVSLGATEIELFLLLFADDLTLLASTIIGLQNQLNFLQSAASRLCLTINLDKSKVVVFRKGGFLGIKEKWTFNGNQLEVVNSYKYLGLTFSTRHSFTAAMEEIAVRAKKSTIEILSTLRKLGCNSPDIFFKLFDTQVVPTLLYGAEIWGYQEYDRLERVHLFACKRFLHVLNKTPNDVVYGELGRYPLRISATIKFVKYWVKLLNQPAHFYSKKAYNMLLNMHEKGHVTWVSRIKSLLCELGFEQVWLFGCGDVKFFCLELKERLCSSFCYTWQAHLETSARLSTYSTHKSCFDREKYVDFIWMDTYRNALAQFRMGVSQINVHRYRFSQTAENVLCPIGCTKRESELHLLFECPLYVQLRNQYLPALCEQGEYRKFVDLMQSESKETTLSLAKFLFFAFSRRSSHISQLD